MVTRPLEGLYVPLVTPFDERGRVDVGCLERLAADALDAGAGGIVALATTAEASSLDKSERRDVVCACARVCRNHDADLIVGAGTNDTRTTVARHEALADLPGVVASLAVVPYYVCPSEAAVVSHFTAVAERSPVPLVIYNVPHRTGRGLGADAVLELAATPNVVGIKQAVGAVDEDTLRVLAEAPDGFSVLAGDDAFLLPVVLMGGAGAISAAANVRTGDFAELVAHGLAERVKEGRGLASALLPLVLALFAEPNPAVIKAALFAQGRLPTPDVRAPLANASADAVRGAMTHLAAALPAATSLAIRR